jgi:hypothetical protein
MVRCTNESQTGARRLWAIACLMLALLSIILILRCAISFDSAAVSFFMAIGLAVCVAFATYRRGRRKGASVNYTRAALSVLLGGVVAFVVLLTHVIVNVIPAMKRGPHYPVAWRGSSDPIILRIMQLRAQPIFARDSGEREIVGLDFRNSAITDADLRLFNKLPHLETLDLFGTQITDIGLAQMREFRSLRRLNLANTYIGNQSLPELSKLDGLEVLDLGGTDISDEGLRSLTAMSMLRELGLDDTRVGAGGISHLTKLRNLEFLSLDRTLVTDAAIDDLGKLLALQEIRGANTPLSDSGMNRLRSLLPNCKIVR